MYRQILIHPDDRNYQLILWRKNKNEEIEEFELNTFIYGETSAPFQAIRTMRELARIYKDKYPLVANAILKDFYMDNGLSGAWTIAQLQELQRQLHAILSEGKFWSEQVKRTWGIARIAGFTNWRRITRVKQRGCNENARVISEILTWHSSVSSDAVTGVNEYKETNSLKNVTSVWSPWSYIPRVTTR